MQVIWLGALLLAAICLFAVALLPPSLVLEKVRQRINPAALVPGYQSRRLHIGGHGGASLLSL